MGGEYKGKKNKEWVGDLMMEKQNLSDIPIA